jgi:acyl-CoA hydrolase
MGTAEDVVGLIRPGDHVLWGQGTAEPVPLADAVVAQRHALAPLSVFVGVCFRDTIRAEHLDAIRVSSYGALGTARRLAAAESLDILPLHVSQLNRAIERGDIRCDVTIVQLSKPGPNGKPSLGPVNDYIRAAMRRARVIIAEVNDQLPWTFGPEPPCLERIALRVETSRPVLEAPTRPPSEVDRAIGEHAATIIPDGATLQLGIGGTIDALLQYLGDRRELGIHSGTIGDSVLTLIEHGVITNSRKDIDRGITVTASLFGGVSLLRAADRNPAFAVHPYEYTHSAAVLAKIPNLVAINSALQVDLTGQVNAEVVGGRYIGAIGGQVDFMHAAARAPSGCSIIALPSTVEGSGESRIRLHVDTVTCARSEVDYIVTEFGAAELKGKSLRERMLRMIAVAHPDHRESLTRDAHSHLARRF